MLHGMHTKNAFIQLKAEGFQFLYRGILPPLCQKTVSVSIMFGMFNHYQMVLDSRVPHWNAHAKKSTAAAAERARAFSLPWLPKPHWLGVALPWQRGESAASPCPPQNPVTAYK